MVDVWDQLQAECLRIYSLPHNVIWFKDREGKTPLAAAQQRVKDVKSGLGGSATRTEFIGPRLFMRAAGPTNAAYAGEWWFDPDQLHGLEAAYARIYFNSADKKTVIRDMLRELLAIKESNQMSEIYALALPSGKRLVGYVGHGAPQPLRDLPGPGNRMLVGKAWQVFILPTHDPCWVTKYSDLRS